MKSILMTVPSDNYYYSAVMSDEKAKEIVRQFFSMDENFIFPVRHGEYVIVHPKNILYLEITEEG